MLGRDLAMHENASQVSAGGCDEAIAEETAVATAQPLAAALPVATPAPKPLPRFATPAPQGNRRARLAARKLETKRARAARNEANSNLGKM